MATTLFSAFVIAERYEEIKWKNGSSSGFVMEVTPDHCPQFLNGLPTASLGSHGKVERSDFQKTEARIQAIISFAQSLNSFFFCPYGWRS
jgi:hypothetical protein